MLTEHTFNIGLYKHMLIILLMVTLNICIYQHRLFQQKAIFNT